MKRTGLILLLFISTYCHAINYDAFDINTTLDDPKLKQTLQTYTQKYFTSEQPQMVIDELLKADLSPLQRETILHNLLTEVSQQPPQEYHQFFVDLMKTYPIQATQDALEGHLPVVIFNLNSKAYGIENIWTAYRTEQLFNQLFEKDLQTALSSIKAIMAEDSTSRRPKWLGIKNSLSSMNHTQLNDLTNFLNTHAKANIGLDSFISHVGLISANTDLINKALQSEQVSVRQYTLRKLSQHLPGQTAKDILLSVASKERDALFSTSLLTQYMSDPMVQEFIIGHLSQKNVAESAAFVISQTDMNQPAMDGFVDQLKNRYLNSANDFEQNQIVMSLKLNPSADAQLALDDLSSQINKSPEASKWLKSFNKNDSTGAYNE
ncbi:MAG: hypothetical protein ACSHWU_13600 [Marinicella sp.]